ncbi:MAG: hypothetical protein VB124_05490, partial [Burkholderia sp.]
NRELSQEPELLTGVLDWLLGINVNRSLARPIYATTPICATTPTTPNSARKTTSKFKRYHPVSGFRGGRPTPEILSSTDRPKTGFCSWAWRTLRKHLANDT